MFYFVPCLRRRRKRKRKWMIRMILRHEIHHSLHGVSGVRATHFSLKKYMERRGKIGRKMFLKIKN